MANIESVMHEKRIFEPGPEVVRQANVSGMEAYRALCAEAERDFTGFWGRLGKENVVWHKPFTQVLDESNAPFFKWFADGELNASYNCLDVPVQAGNGDKVAIVFEADDGKVTRITYRELLAKVCQLANGIKSLGYKKGERAIIYMPMSIEAVLAMLACARLGITHSVVFGGFSAKSVQERVVDAGATLMICADEQMRGGKAIPLKPAIEDAFALGGCEAVRKVIVYQRTGGPVAFNAGRDVWMHELMAGQPTTCEPEWVNAEHPLFILYTSGSTGKPKGVQHSTGGYLLWAALTMKWTFDIKPADVFWCTADVGWVTGHTYVCYGPLATGATEVIFEGVPTYPDAGRFWKMCQDHGVTIFYTAPTAIRSLIKANEANQATHPTRYDLSKLRILGTVGEPINPEAWMWYYNNVGQKRCPVVDTFWQTEMLVVKRPWPAMIRTIWGDPERYKKSYYPAELGGQLYLAGDGSIRDKETGYFTIVGRIDDVLNVSGHRMGTMEIESALVANPLVAEAAVVGRPDETTGEAICAFVVLKQARPTGEAAQKLARELRDWVGKEIGPIAKPKDIRFGDNLPKTRSGKIMRRLLRSIAKGEEIAQDVSTLENPAILDQLKVTL